MGELCEFCFASYRVFGQGWQDIGRIGELLAGWTSCGRLGTPVHWYKFALESLFEDIRRIHACRPYNLDISSVI